MNSATWSPGRRPASCRTLLSRLAAASSSAYVWTQPLPAMMTAGRSGASPTKAPGCTTGRVQGQPRPASKYARPMTTLESQATTEERVNALVDELLEQYPPSTTPPATFLGAQFDAGLAWIHFGVGHGGLDLPAKLQGNVNARLQEAKAPSPVSRNPIGHGMCGPTVHVWGSETQKARYLRPLFTGEEIWCQLFSEPSAGSDFAGLSSKAVRDGDEWIVNGQKVWTTLAHLARWGLLVVRTDAEAVKHAGMTAFVVDMQAPGVEVRPLYQITGEAEFNEVFFTDVRIPDGERLGNPGDGWRVSLTTLMNERVSIGGAIPPKGSGVIGDLVRVWKDMPDDERKNAAVRDTVMKL